MADEYAQSKEVNRRLLLPLLELQVVMNMETVEVLVVIVIVVFYLMPQLMQNMQRTL